MTNRLLSIATSPTLQFTAIVLYTAYHCTHKTSIWSTMSQLVTSQSPAQSLTPLDPVTEFSPSLVRVLGLNPGKFTLQGTNTYLLGRGDRRILIDTGDGKEDYIGLLQSVLPDNATIEHVLITHWHHDHVGGVAQIRAAFPHAKVWKFPLARSDVPSPELDDTGQEYMQLTTMSTFDVDGDASQRIKVVHLPGHTKDHVVFVMEAQSAVFTGDCVLGEGSAVFESLHQYMNSLHILADILERHNAVIYPGHGPIVENGAAKVRAYIEHRMTRERQIVQVLKEAPRGGRTPAQLVDVIYAEMNLDKVLKRAAENSVVQHLYKLLEDERVRNVPDSDRWELIVRASM